MLIICGMEIPFVIFLNLSSSTLARFLIPLPSVVLSSTWLDPSQFLLQVSLPTILDPGRWSHTQNNITGMKSCPDWLNPDLLDVTLAPDDQTIQKLFFGLWFEFGSSQVSLEWWMETGIHYLDWWPASGPQEVEPIVIQYLTGYLRAQTRMQPRIKTSTIEEQEAFGM